MPSGAPYISSLVYYDGLIYMTGDVGVLTVTDAKTGERVYQERVGGVYTASPVAADGKVYLVSEDGETIVLAAGRTPTVLARNKLNARQLASPAIAGGRLFIRVGRRAFTRSGSNAGYDKFTVWLCFWANERNLGSTSFPEFFDPRARGHLSSKALPSTALPLVVAERRDPLQARLLPHGSRG